MLYFEQKSFDAKDWKLLLDAGTRLVGMGMINQMTIRAFLTNLAQRLEGKPTFEDETFLGYLKASSVAELLERRGSSSVKGIELISSSPIGLITFLVLSIVLYKSIRVNDGARPITEDMCMELLAEELFKEVNDRGGELFKSAELRGHLIACFDAFFMGGHLDFVEEVFQRIGERGGMLEVGREKAIIMLAFFLSGHDEKGNIQ